MKGFRALGLVLKQRQKAISSQGVTESRGYYSGTALLRDRNFCPCKTLIESLYVSPLLRGQVLSVMTITGDNKSERLCTWTRFETEVKGTRNRRD